MNDSVKITELIANTLANINTNKNISPPDWLISDFNDPVWSVKLESISILDFQVLLEDGTLLTDEKNLSLLLFFKKFLLAQSNPQFNRGVSYSNKSLISRLSPAIHICEYMIVRSAELKLGRFGLSAIPNSFSHKLMRDVSLYESADSIYQFRIRLKQFLNKVSADLLKEDFLKAKRDVPSIARSGGCDYLGFSEVEIQKARAWLWINGFYRQSSYEGSSRYVLNTSKISDDLYPGGILRTRWRKPVIDSLVIGHGPLLNREATGVPVRALDRAESAIRYYIRALRIAASMGQLDLAIPSGLTAILDDKQFVQQLPLSEVGRYTTLPYAVVLKSLRYAIEFFLGHGPHLLKAYLTTAENAIRSKSTMTMAARSLVKSGHPHLKEAGIECWSISTELRADRGRGLLKTSEKIQSDFYRELRRGVGLHEQLQVLWGSLLISTGAVMARRQGELLDLQAGDLFDKSRTRLKFHARKRNVGSRRERITRPIPEVIVRFMISLEEFQSNLIHLGVLEKERRLLSFPLLHYPGLTDSDDEACNHMLDRFCDFFEIDKDSNGHRYYIRQHQLRRFFAMLFFWGNSYSGLESLRWFLGHTDARHLYNYITESTPGEVLKSVKVDFAIERLREESASADSLASSIKSRFNTNSIQVLDNAELAGVISELLETGGVTIEPHFFEGHSGQEYVILIRIERELK